MALKNRSSAQPLAKKRPHEASFSLLETVIALGLMVTILLESSLIQGKAITFSEFNRHTSQATWLAKAVLEKVEWGSRFYPFKELKADLRDQKFPESFCPPYDNRECVYRFNLKVEDFKLPITDLITKQLGGGPSEEDGDGGSGLGDVLGKTVQQYLGDEILKIARVEVTWPEGSKQGSVDLAYLLTNQRHLDEQIFGQKPLRASNSGGAVQGGFERREAPEGREAPLPSGASEGRGPFGR